MQQHSALVQRDLEAWVDRALEGSHLNDQMKNRCRMLARSEIQCGGFRGDISDAWAKAYPVAINTLTVPDLYV